MALSGSCFDLSENFSPEERSASEEMMVGNGGTMAKSVSDTSGTNQFQEVKSNNIPVVDEDWVHDRISASAEKKVKATTDMQPTSTMKKTKTENANPHESVSLNFLETDDSMVSPDGEGDSEDEDSEDSESVDMDGDGEAECYLTEMLDMGLKDDGFPSFSKKSVGTKLGVSEDAVIPDIDSNATYIVVSCCPVAGGRDTMMLKNMDNDEADLIEVDWSSLVDNFRTLPPKAAEELWNKYQNRKITEGVWEGGADSSLLTEINSMVDTLALQEPIDLHPGTKDVVRDLVHPSLFPLISDPSDVSKSNFWGRPYEASRFQWLPAEVEIDNDGNPRFVSDINNLDRSKYSDLYTGLEHVFKELLPGFQKVWQYARSMSFTEEDNGMDDPELINFHASTLQAVVKIADYEFQPGAEFEGVWHYEGMSHENIVMTGLFYPNSDENLEGGGLEFKRIYNDDEVRDIFEGVNQDRAQWFDEMLQVGFLPLGQTTTETGKLLVFPNCHAHRVMKMVNNSADVLHRRLVVFFVIDPDDRIPSSRDFPPLPRQISLEQALADRLELMQERKQAKQSLNPREIELCEH